MHWTKFALFAVASFLGFTNSAVASALNKHSGPCPDLAISSDQGLMEDLRAASSDARYSHLRKLFKRIKECQQRQSATSQPTLPASLTTLSSSPVSSNSKTSAKSSNLNETKSAPTDFAGQFRFLLREDFSDISLVTYPTWNSGATGASIGYSSDRVANNKTWTIHGTAVGAYNFDFGYGPMTSVNLFAGSLGLYAGVNKFYNSNSRFISQNTDNETFGGFIELGFDNIVGGQQWVRVRSGIVHDSLTDNSALAATLEWIPVYSNLWIHFPHFFSLPFSQIGIRFDPELKVQYDNAGNQTLLFSNGHDSLRVGPQFSLWIQPFADISTLDRLNINLTYHYAYETYSGTDLSWFRAAATYNLDLNGMLGFTGSYQRGSDENTGRQVDLYKLTLTGKLDYCTAWC